MLSEDENKVPSPKHSKYAANRLDSEIAFGHELELLPHINLEDESFAQWYRKTSGTFASGTR